MQKDDAEFLRGIGIESVANETSSLVDSSLSPKEWFVRKVADYRAENPPRKLAYQAPKITLLQWKK
jgi:hypothetical protein